MAASAVLVARDTLAKGGGAKLLEVGTLLLLSALAIYSMFASPDWSILGVRLCVDAGLLLIVILSLAMGRPFTMQYVRERVPRELWSSPEFIRTNAVITSVWGLAFTIVVGVDLVMFFVPELPMRHSIVVTVLALVGAFKFSAWYPDRDRARPQRPVI